MRKWILFALIGLVLLYALSFREGVNDTLSPPATCPSGMTLDLTNARMVSGPQCVGPNGRATPTCSSGFLSFNGTCVSQAACDKFWDTYTTTVAAGNSIHDLIAGDRATAEICARNTEPPWWNSVSAADRRYNGNGPPPDALKAAAAAHLASSATPDPTKYSDILKNVQDANNGPLPSPINESADIDTGAARPTTGPVFASGGPFSGQSGTGRGSGASAAAGMTGNTYGQSGPMPSLSPFDFYPKSSMSAPSPAPPGSSLRVKGPSWGGKGQSASSASASSSIANPFLYGPGSGNKSSSGSDGSGFGFQLNSGDTSMLPSLDSLGSNPENQYAVTSRVPGDQDLVPNPYLQSTSYSLANNSQKTDPVPFLANFSAFQR